MLEMPREPAAGTDEAEHGPEAGAPREEAPAVTCRYCDIPIPDEMVATGIHGGRDGCWNALPTELA